VGDYSRYYLGFQKNLAPEVNSGISSCFFFRAGLVEHKWDNPNNPNQWGDLLFIDTRIGLKLDLEKPGVSLWGDLGYPPWIAIDSGQKQSPKISFSFGAIKKLSKKIEITYSYRKDTLGKGNLRTSLFGLAFSF